MTRRSFLKVLVASGLVSAANLSALSIPEVETYPEIHYTRDWIIIKQTYLHMVSATANDKDIWYVEEYCDEKELPEDILNDMMAKLKEKL